MPLHRLLAQSVLLQCNSDSTDRLEMEILSVCGIVTCTNVPKRARKEADGLLVINNGCKESDFYQFFTA